MKQKKIFYIGSFPEPFGGATIKNEITFNELSKHISINKFNTSTINGKTNVIKYADLILFLIKNIKNKGIICVGSYSLFTLTKIMAVIKKSMLPSISVFVVGGIMPKLMKERKEDLSLYKLYKNIYVETEKMRVDLNNMGLYNVHVIPNCRPKPDERSYYKPNNKKLKCIYLSRICKEKGVIKILDSFKSVDHLTEKVEVDFYGPIAGDIYNEFTDKISSLPNACYKGVINAAKENIYKILQEYDLLLFPTDHEGEGFPGILAESKIAGIPVVASNINYNGEIVNNLVDGVILEENSMEKLSYWIEKLVDDRDLLEKFRKNSFNSGEKYFIEDYSENIIKKL